LSAGKSAKALSLFEFSRVYTEAKFRYTQRLLPQDQVFRLQRCSRPEEGEVMTLRINLSRSVIGWELTGPLLASTLNRIFGTQAHASLHSAYKRILKEGQRPRVRRGHAGVSANSQLTLQVDHLMTPVSVAERIAIGAACNSLE
jgi:hypothetical protein